MINKTGIQTYRNYDQVGMNSDIQDSIICPYVISQLFDKNMKNVGFLFLQAFGSLFCSVIYAAYFELIMNNNYYSFINCVNQTADKKVKNNHS